MAHESRATAESLTVLLTESVGSDGTALQGWVLQALEKKRGGDGTSFQQLVDSVDRNTDLAEQAALVGCLSRCTASLQKKRHSDLTSMVLQRGFRAHEQLTSAIEAFAVNCVSANADLLASILHELVKHFTRFDLLAATPPETKAEAEGRAVRMAHMTEADIQDHAQIARDVHRVVQRVLETFPTGTMSFLDQLVQAYPHRVKRVAEQRAYLANILHVTSYQPQLLPDILACVTERLIKIDVEVDPQVLEALNTGAIDVADDDALFGLEMEETSEDRKKMLENAEKLDSMMLIILQFFRSIFADREVAKDYKDNVMKALLATFQDKILTTFRSKYSQYLIFYACHFQTQYSREFLQSLILIVISSEYSDGIRHAAGSYLGSYLARAKYLKLSNIEVTLRLLVTWILEYMDKESAVQGPDPLHHSLFYSLVQALLYTLCFRLPQLMASDNAAKFETFLRLELRLQDIVLCPLNPLKVIDQAVGGKFVTLAVKYRLIQTQALRDLLEYNKSIIVPGVVEFEEEHSFFPFDKYNLKESCHLVQGLYQEWVEASDDVFSEDEAAPPGWARDVDGSDGASESIAMSLTSQLSLSDHNQHSGDASPASNWRPMSFSPSRETVDVSNPLHRGMR